MASIKGNNGPWQNAEESGWLTENTGIGISDLVDSIKWFLRKPLIR